MAPTDEPQKPSMMKNRINGPGVSANTMIPVDDIAAKLGAFNIDDQTARTAAEAGKQSHED